MVILEAGSGKGFKSRDRRDLTVYIVKSPEKKFYLYIHANIALRVNDCLNLNVSHILIIKCAI